MWFSPKNIVKIGENLFYYIILGDTNSNFTDKNSTRKKPNAYFYYFNFFIKSKIVCLPSCERLLYKFKTFLSSLL